MSLINDALKKAQKNQPASPPLRMHPLPPPPLPPAKERSLWPVLVVVLLLVAAAIFIVGWSSSHHTVEKIVTAPASAPVPAESDAAPAEVAVPAPSPPAPVADPLPTPEETLRLQGIFYSPTAATAIIEGKTVRAGDRFRQYRVREITKFTVILSGPDGKLYELTMH